MGNSRYCIQLLINALDCNARLPSIEVKVLDRCDCIADFNPYCSSKIRENVKSAGY